MRGVEHNYAMVRVHFATDRLPLPSAELPERRFGNQRGDGGILFGTADVSIPRDHRLGELEAPSIWRLEFREDPEKHVVVLAVDPQDRQEFIRSLRERIESSENGKAFIFVHGYNVSFGDAARRTAQLHYDLGFAGAPLFYSWPSRSELLGYRDDETTVEWSIPHLKDFFSEVAQLVPAEGIYVIAHSMGNRPTSRALAEVFRDHPEYRPRFKEIILMAPDIDAEVFRAEIAPALVAESQRVTLYASNRDLALKVARSLHGRQRLGDADPHIVVIPGVESIDASAVETDLIGHSYYAEARSVLADLFDVVRDSGPAPRRRHLLEAVSEIGRFWRFRTPEAPPGELIGAR